MSNLLSGKNQYTIILYHVFTEKSQLAIALGQYTFVVDKQSTKRQVADAISRLYDVKVDKVCISNYKPRRRRTMKGYKHQAGYKKARVMLAKGQVIDFEKIA